MSVANIIINIAVTSPGLAPALTQINAQINSVTSGIGGLSTSLRRMGLEMSRVGTLITAGITVPLGFMAKASVDSFMEFELGMRRVSSLIKGITESEFRTLYTDTKKLASAMGVDLVKAADALYEIISTGIPPENAISFLGVATKAGIAGVSDTKTAVNALTTVINAYQLSTTEAATVSDALFRAVDKGKFTFAQLASALAHSMPIAAQLGVTYKEILAAAAAMSLQGFTVNQSMIRIAMSMNSLLKPTKYMVQLFDELKVASGPELLQKFGGLQGAMTALRNAAEGNVSVLSKAIGRYQGLQAILSLTGKNTETFTRIMREMTDSSGAAGKAFDQIDKSLSRTWDRMKVKFQELKVTIGEALQPAVYALAKSLESVIAKMMQWVEAFKQLPVETQAAILKMLLLAAAIGPLLIVFGKLTMLVADLASLFTSGGLLAGVASAGAGFTALAVAVGVLAGAFAAFKVGAMIGAWDSLADVGANLLEVVKALGQALGGGLSAGFEVVKLMVMPTVIQLKAFSDTVSILTGAGPLQLLVSLLGGIGEAYRILGNVVSTVTGEMAYATKIGLAEWVRILQDAKIQMGVVWEEMKKGTLGVWESTKTELSSILDGIGKYMDAVWANAAESQRATLGPMADFTIAVFEKIGNLLQPVLDKIKGQLDSWVNAAKAKMAEWSASIRKSVQEFSEAAAILLDIMMKGRKYYEEQDAAAKAQSKSLEALKASFVAASASFEAIAKAAQKGSEEYNAALLSMQEAQVALLKAMEQTVPSTLTKSILELKAELIAGQVGLEAATKKTRATAEGARRAFVEGKISAEEYKKILVALTDTHRELAPAIGGTNVALGRAVAVTKEAYVGTGKLAEAVKQAAVFAGDGVVQNANWARSIQLVQSAADQCATEGIEVLKGSTVALKEETNSLSGSWDNVNKKWVTAADLIARVNAGMKSTTSATSSLGKSVETLGTQLNRASQSFSGMTMNLMTWMGMVGGFLGGAGGLAPSGTMGSYGIEDFAKVLEKMGYVRTGQRSWITQQEFDALSKAGEDISGTGVAGGSAVGNVSEVGQSLAGASSNLTNNLKGASDAAGGASSALGDLGKQVKGTGKDIGDVGDAADLYWRKIDGSLTNVDTSLGRTSKSLSSMGGELGETTQGLGFMGGSFDGARVSANGVGVALNGLAETAEGVTRAWFQATEEYVVMVEEVNGSLVSTRNALTSLYSTQESNLARDPKYGVTKQLLGMSPAGSLSLDTAVNPNVDYRNTPWVTGEPSWMQSNQVSLNVYVNNADAKKVADTMISTWRTRGVDI